MTLETLETLQLARSDPAWNAFVRDCPTALPFHHPSWSGLLGDCYAYSAAAMAVVDRRGQIVGGIPVVDVRKPFGARRYVGLPFTDYCPLLSTGSPRADVAQAISNGAARLRLNALEIRDALPPGEHVHTTASAVRHTLALSGGPDSVAHGVSKHHRRNIRRAEQSNLTLRQGTSRSEMRAFYRLHVMTRQRLGVPVQPWGFFDSL